MGEKYSVKSEKRILIGNLAVLAGILIMTVGCFNEISWYNVMAPLGTVISFVALVVAMLAYADIKELFKDFEFYLMVFADAVTLINIFLVSSGIGAFFTVADFLLVLFLANKIMMPRKMLMGLGIYIAFFFFYWTVDVKGYFKGYNTNYGGLVLITGFAFAMIMLFILKSYLKNKGNKKGNILMYIPLVFMFFLGYNIISWYRARCALLGLGVILILILLPRKIWNVKILYGLMVIGSTFGAILMSIAYVVMGMFNDRFTIRIFYKDVVSGRNEIWSELWQEYLKHPLTGIGSNYTMKLDWMQGMFEVHNGLLDILIVHGLIVFLIVAVFLCVRLFGIRKYAVSSTTGKVVLAGIMAMLASSFLENYVIVPPFTLCFLMLFIFIRSELITL